MFVDFYSCYFLFSSSIKKVYAALLISAHKLPNSISVSLCSKMFLAISTILSVVRCPSNTALFNISSYSSEVPRVYKSKSIHSCFKLFLVIILSSFIFFLPLVYIIAPPRPFVKRFLKNCKIKKQDVCPAFLVL